MNNIHLSRTKTTSTLKRLNSKFKAKIGFSTVEGIFIVNVNEILFLRASSNYTEVHLKNGKMLLVSKTLKLIEEMLPESGFKRCHQSYVINLEEVVMLNDFIILTNEAEIPISRRKKNEFKCWFLGRVAFV